MCLELKYYMGRHFREYCVLAYLFRFQLAPFPLSFLASYPFLFVSSLRKSYVYLVIVHLGLLIVRQCYISLG